MNCGSRWWMQCHYKSVAMLLQTGIRGLKWWMESQRSRHRGGLERPMLKSRVSHSCSGYVRIFFVFFFSLNISAHTSYNKVAQSGCVWDQMLRRNRHALNLFITFEFLFRTKLSSLSAFRYISEGKLWYVMQFAREYEMLLRTLQFLADIVFRWIIRPIAQLPY